MKNAERTAPPDPAPEAVPEFDWEAVLESTSKCLYSPPSWLSSVKVRAIEGKSVCLETENQFQADWAKNHYLGLIREEAGKIYGSGLFEFSSSVVPRPSPCSDKNLLLRRGEGLGTIEATFQYACLLNCACDVIQAGTQNR